MTTILTLTLSLAALLHADPPAPPAGPPVAPSLAHEMWMHGDVRQDPWFWMRDKTKPETIQYLKAENDYANQKLGAFTTPVAKLVEEMKSHVREEDTSLPFRSGAYEYWNKYQKGKEYPVFLRRPIDQAANEQIVLDENALAVGHDYTSVGSHHVTDDGKLLAYSLDLKGDRLYTIQVKNLETGRPLDDVITDTSGEIAWAADNVTFFYVKLEPQTLRARWVYRHRLGETKDTLVFEEKDEKFNASIYRSVSRRLIFIATESKESTEVSYIEALQPTGLPKLFQSRLRDVQYQVVDGVDRFYVRTNLRAENFRVVEVPLAHTSVEHWTDVLPHHADTYVKDLYAFKTHLVTVERHEGLVRFRVIPRGAKAAGRIIKPKLPDYYADGDANAEYAATFFRYAFEGLATPTRVVDVDLASGRETTRKVDQVPGGFKASNYDVKRLFAKAADGARIPGVLGLPQRHAQRSGHPAAPVRVRLVRNVDRLVLLAVAVGASGSRLRLRHRARARRIRDGPALVPERQTDEQEEHLHRLPGGRAPLDRNQVDLAASPVRAGRKRGRIADGRGHQPGTNVVPRGDRQGAVRRRGLDHAGRVLATDHRGVRRVG